jgi:uncharacterized protein (TIGR02001 family)
VKRILGTLLLWCLGNAVTQADQPGAPSPEPGSAIISGSVGATSDFVYRGLSLTRGKPALQASIDVEFPREFYVGGFIANADPNPGPSPNFEFDVWAGKYWRVTDDLSVDLRLSQYTYPDDPRHVNYNRSEVTATVGYRNRFFMAAIYSPNTQAVSSAPGYKNDGAWALEISGRHSFDERWSVAGGVGHYGLDGVYGRSYNYFNATLIAALKPFEFQLAWLGVDGAAEDIFPEDAVGSRVAFTALWRFSTAP